MKKIKLGRPPILLPCTFCRKPFGVVSRRAHEPTCAKRPKKMNDFWIPTTIDNIISEQQVGPVADIGIFSGAIPDEDMDEFVTGMAAAPEQHITDLQMYLDNASGHAAH